MPSSPIRIRNPWSFLKRISRIIRPSLNPYFPASLPDGVLSSFMASPPSLIQAMQMNKKFGIRTKKDDKVEPCPEFLLCIGSTLSSGALVDYEFLMISLALPSALMVVTQSLFLMTTSFWSLLTSHTRFPFEFLNGVMLSPPQLSLKLYITVS